MSSYYGLTIKISDLNPLRFAQDGRIDTNYQQSMFRDTLFTTTDNKVKYIQKFRFGDQIRVQVCTYGTITNELYEFKCEGKIVRMDDTVMDTFFFVEKTGTWNNGDLHVYECNYYVYEPGEYYMTIDNWVAALGFAEKEKIHLVSEPFLVSESNNCIPKIIYSDSKNYPQYDMYFSTGIICQMRAEVAVNQKPEVDLINHTDNVRNVLSIHPTFYDNYEVFPTIILPVWLVRKLKFALATEACQLNYEYVTLTGNDDIEIVEDGVGGCTFKFKVAPKLGQMSTELVYNETPNERKKAFDDICSSDSVPSDCGCGVILVPTRVPVDWADITNKPFEEEVTLILHVADWVDFGQSKVIDWVGVDNDILVIGSTVLDRDNVEVFGITASQSVATLSFLCEEVPTSDISINIKLLV